jgi:putrescine transport system ATP-binding protein
VDGVSIDIARGEVFALLGSSGCGKTTLLRMLAGFEAPTSGSIVLEGRDLAGLAPHERPMNMMFQSYALFPHLTVHDNIAFGLKREGRPRGEIEARVEELLKLVQLAGYGARKPHQLSGGQQQRVALARSLAKKPRLLLLDEPLGALDRKLREETQIELARIVHDIGVTCVLVTHDQEEAMTLASRIAVMDKGRFLQVGEPRDLYENPASRFVADFIGDVNLMDGALVESGPDGSTIDCGDVRCAVDDVVEGPAGRAVAVAIRPEKIAIARAAGAGEPAVNRVQGTVREAAYFGSYSVYHVALASGRLLKALRNNAEREVQDLPERGEQAWVSWLPESPVVLTA